MNKISWWGLNISHPGIWHGNSFWIITKPEDSFEGLALTNYTLTQKWKYNSIFCTWSMKYNVSILKDLDQSFNCQQSPSLTDPLL